MRERVGPMGRGARLRGGVSFGIFQMRGVGFKICFRGNLGNTSNFLKKQ